MQLIDDRLTVQLYVLRSAIKKKVRGGEYKKVLVVGNRLVHVLPLKAGMTQGIGPIT